MQYGEITFPFGMVKRQILAGPFRSCPLSFGQRAVLRIKLAKEIDAPAEINIPIKDFGIPEEDGEVYNALNAALEAMTHGHPVYVGCMGGIGRTGMFLSLLAKALGIDHPVKYVRANYLEYAVERDEQHEYIRRFDVEPLRKAVLLAKLKAGWYDTMKLFGVNLVK